MLHGMLSLEIARGIRVLREHIAYLYDKRAVTFTGLAAEADPPRQWNRRSRQYEPTITWWSSPFMAYFSAGNFDWFALVAVQ